MEKFKLIHLGEGKQIAVPLETEPRQAGWYWDFITNKPWLVTDDTTSLANLEYSETHYPDSVSDRIIASNFPIATTLPMWKFEDVNHFTVEDLRKAFEMGQTCQSRLINNLPINGFKFGDLLESHINFINFETATVGTCSCICHRSNHQIMHITACCHPRSVLKTTYDSEGQVWLNKK